ncbi:super-infection exclusion protein B [Flavobacterium sp.]|uniref:super-infection exclusion protein B n=1 Tax=Flavobacterium sp. TaxID=239 RepID=UPI0025C660B6|nr:super-infection exclusion protein B [Flavobacterium sp.]
MGIEDFFKGIFDVKKIPTKVFLVVFIAGTFMFYAPQKFATIQFKEESDLKIYAYITYLICTGIFIVNCITVIVTHTNNYLLNRRLKKEYKKLIHNLDNYERSVLREFYLYQKNTLDFPYDDNIIKGLVDKKVLYFASLFGSSIMPNGRNSTFKINRYLKNIISKENDLGLVNNPNKEQQGFILQNRPH